MVPEIQEKLQQSELSARIIECRVGLPVKCLPFPSWSGQPLALICAWAPEELTMVLEIQELFQQAEVSARIIVYRVGLPVNSSSCRVWHWLLFKYGPMRS